MPQIAASTQLPSQSNPASGPEPSQTPHSSMLALPPPHTPQSSFSKVEPHVLSQPEGPASKQPQP